MFLEIVTPEAILFSSEVDAISVPGVNGEFQMLNNHAPIVSILKEGTIKIHVHTQEHLELNDLSGHFEAHIDDDKILTLAINSGTLELNDNKAIILAD
ncbi:MAG: F0F1 ATP synthase subunit epsilon [Polaribacter sp.]|uniref:FoF1 ATP synthase subunit delta/epsilon n=1 Tax=Polaribacter sp. TaxID=1920175 RepID=UPI002F35CF30